MLTIIITAVVTLVVAVPVSFAIANASYQKRHLQRRLAVQKTGLVRSLMRLSRMQRPRSVKLS